MQKKDDKVANQTANKNGGKKKESEKFWLLRMREKQKSCLITSGYSENVPFLVAKLVFSHSYAN